MTASLIISVLVFALFFLLIINSEDNHVNDFGKVLCDKDIVTFLDDNTCYSDLTMGVVGRPYLKSEMFEIEIDSSSNKLSNCDCLAARAREIKSDGDFSIGANLKLKSKLNSYPYKTIEAYYCVDETVALVCGSA